MALLWGIVGKNIFFFIIYDKNRLLRLSLVRLMRKDEKGWERMRKDEKGWERMREDERGWERMREDERGWRRMREDERGWEKMRKEEKGWERTRKDEKGWENLLFFKKNKGTLDKVELHFSRLLPSPQAFNQEKMHVREKHSSLFCWNFTDEEGGLLLMGIGHWKTILRSNLSPFWG